ncbi:aldose 1-epimerase [Silvimonas sp. JCM 19000]
MSSAPGTVTLKNAQLLLEVMPQLAGGIARFDWLGGATPQAIFRPRDPAASPTEPNSLSCYTMVPWSNRIGHGTFEFEGKTYVVPRTRDNEQYPIHGHGAFAPWQVTQQDDSAVTLSHTYTGPGPFAYHATQSYTLDGPRLRLRVTVTNQSPTRLPFGLGLHPFFPRTPDVLVAAPAQAYWRAAEDDLPIELVPVSGEFDYRLPRALPETTRINHAFSGAQGVITVFWPQRELHVELMCDSHYYVFYSPPGRDYFCVEPADHPVNALNLPDGPHGLTVLQQGETLQRDYVFTVRDDAWHPTEDAA